MDCRAMRWAAVTLISSWLCRYMDWLLPSSRLAGVTAAMPLGALTNTAGPCRFLLCSSRS
ncbi:hypothetical protein D3C76_1801550 [compost metagenome]